jgi:hypothetical protein
MTSMRRVRENLRALQDKMATDVQQRIVWVDHEPGESHSDAVSRTMTERGLTGQEPGLMLISWLAPQLTTSTSGG